MKTISRRLIAGAIMTIAAGVGMVLGRLAYEAGLLNSSAYGLAALQFIGMAVILSLTPFAAPRNN